MNYTIKDYIVNDVLKLGVTLDEYPHVSFFIEYVNFQEKDNGLILNFHYTIIEGGIEDNQKKAFETAIGDFITEYYFNQDKDAPVVYKGGT